MWCDTSVAESCIHLCSVSNYLVCYCDFCKFIFQIVFFLSLNFDAPIKSSTFFYQMPESPLWLLAQNRHIDAKKSLQWLRGWTTSQTIHTEYIELQKYCDESTACDACAQRSNKCTHAQPTFCDKIKAMKRKKMLKPFIVVSMLYLIFIFCTMTAIQSFIVQVLKAFGSPINVNVASICISGVGVLGAIFLILIIKKVGRRPIYFVSSAIVVLCSFGLGLNVFFSSFVCF